MNSPAPATDAAQPPVPTRMLVHALIRADGTVDAGQLYTVAGVLGMSDQQVRLCLKRLVAEGLFTHEGRGRKALLHAAPDATGMVVPEVGYVRHAYRQDLGLAPWDGTWRLFAFAVPEASRTARDALRDSLLRLGAAPIQGGLYVSANPIGDLVEPQARHLGVAASVTYFTSNDLRMGDLSDPPALAAALWPLADIAARYQQLAHLARHLLDALTRLDSAVPDRVDGPGGHAGSERLAMTVRLAAAFTHAMEPDPLLPPELLPQPWPGTTARRLAADCWSALAESDRRNTESGPPPRLFTLYEDLVPR
ncbi:hypothetical protein C5N14_12895 [Micromonospora sp. MW-13]|uniref:PaaX family transcriptional regulator C-terminal domain-containing protein n=1 Tax=Micromonospora sp. MW-13 TaxID=2094022 RepID=UPI000EE418B7|nr:PaaX family transcriptional regulator C-terminal domain-containing protein [Micromonospora sp. MW-13]RGC68591.1 hypothetical protein C5N14_12895 [Micromonospora sp. MW-13]